MSSRSLMHSLNAIVLCPKCHHYWMGGDVHAPIKRRRKDCNHVSAHDCTGTPVDPCSECLKLSQQLQH